MPSVPPAIRSLGKIHHVALIVASIETALGFWRDTVGAPLETIMDIEQDRVRIAFLTVGESKIELVQPTDDTTGVARFLANKGEGFHHVCFEVPNLAEALMRLEIDGIELIDSAPRRSPSRARRASRASTTSPRASAWRMTSSATAGRR